MAKAVMGEIGPSTRRHLAATVNVDVDQAAFE